jgi:hypothetical protein
VPIGWAFLALSEPIPNITHSGDYEPLPLEEHFAILRKQLPLLNPFTLALMALPFLAVGTIVADFVFSAQRRFWSSYSQNLSERPGNSGVYDNKAVGKHLVWLITGGVLATAVPVGWLLLILSEPSTGRLVDGYLTFEDHFYILCDCLPRFFKGRDDRIFTRSTFALVVLAFFATGIVVAQFVFLAQRRFWSSYTQNLSKEQGNSGLLPGSSLRFWPYGMVGSVLIGLSLTWPCVAVLSLFPFFLLAILVAVAVGSIGGWYRDRLFTWFTYSWLLFLSIWHDFQTKPLDYKWLYDEATKISLTLAVTILTHALVAKSRGLQDEERIPAAKGAASSSETAVSETAVFSKNEQ